MVTSFILSASAVIRSLSAVYRGSARMAVVVSSVDWPPHPFRNVTFAKAAPPADECIPDFRRAPPPCWPLRDLGIVPPPPNATPPSGTTGGGSGPTPPSSSRRRRGKEGAAAAPARNRLARLSGNNDSRLDRNKVTRECDRPRGLHNPSVKPDLGPLAYFEAPLWAVSI